MDTKKSIQFINPPFSREKVSNRRKFSAVHYHEKHYELYCLVDGTTKYFIGDEIYVLKKGDFVFIPNGILHKTDSEECLHNERILLSFDDSIFNNDNSFLIDELTNSKFCRISEKHLYKLEEIMGSLEKEYEREDIYSKNLRKTYIIQLLTLLCRYRRPATTSISESDKIVFEVSNFIKGNYDKNITLKLICKEFSVNESYLSKKFKKVSGTGINEYITYVRIMNAETLLKENKYSITEIAYKCGFNDSNYFSTVFKKIKGIAPLKYSKGT